MAGTVTVTVQDGGAVPIAEADVSLLRSDGFLECAQQTNSSGQVVFSTIAAGVYTLRTYKPGWRAADQSVTVASIAVAVTVTATSLAIVNPTPPSTCRVWGFVQIPAGGTFIARVEVWAEEAAQGSPTVLLGSGSSGVRPSNIRAVSQERLTLVDRNGRWEFEFVRGTRVSVRIPAINFSKTITVPNKDAVCIDDVLAILQGENLGLAGESTRYPNS